MRIARTPGELPEAVGAAAREAEAAFGDGTVFVEPYIERGRHVEVQILGDAHGGVVHLGERECSLQRRNQKVLEEAPSAGISDDVRSALCEGALALARHVGYQGAGTVEFLVGADGTISFLEVNTRLQVEHPVTEAVCGLDLVELQLRIAAGEPLPLTQDDVRVDGHAIEVRVVAEDPAAGWLPSTGTIGRFELRPPGTGSDHGTARSAAAASFSGVRVDAGVRAGSVVSADYDSLLAKVVVHAPTRTEAAHRLARVLRQATVTGVRTNLDALAAVLTSDDFLAADTTTAFLDEHPELLDARGPEGDDRLVQLLAAVVADEQAARAADRRWGFAPSGWRNLRTQGQRRTWLDDRGEETEVELTARGAGRYEALVGPVPRPGPDGALAPDERRRVDLEAHVHAGRAALTVDGVRRTLQVGFEGDTAVVVAPSGSTTWTPAPRFDDHDAASAAGGRSRRCPARCCRCTSSRATR
jgi:propionyl-CoA carboxylase alpha chain